MSVGVALLVAGCSAADSVPDQTGGWGPDGTPDLADLLGNEGAGRPTPDIGDAVSIDTAGKDVEDAMKDGLPVGVADGGSDTGPDNLVAGHNPVLGGDHPDPAVLREVDEGGAATYYLYHTSGCGVDVPVWTSADLIHWEKLPQGAFHRTGTPGGSLELNGVHYCHIWAPHVAKLGSGSYMLSFSAQRHEAPKSGCPGYANDGGVYLAWSNSPTGPFAPVEHPWEPLPAGGHVVDCSPAVEADIPHSVDWTKANCQGGNCHRIIRLDSEAWLDKGTWWMAYSWYTNNPPMVDWELENHGEHVSLVNLDPDDPFTIPCDPAKVTEVYVGNPHDQWVIDQLAAYCEGCGEMLSMTRGKWGEEMAMGGASWGVVEGASFLRRQEWVYMFMSGSAWDSAYYHVFWVAAKTVGGLSRDNAERLAGRYLIPNNSNAFGHGFPVQGPDGQSWYYVHHRLNSPSCQAGNCARDLWVSPLEFEDRKDGLGDVWITPRWPSEGEDVHVKLW